MEPEAMLMNDMPMEAMPADMLSPADLAAYSGMADGSAIEGSLLFNLAIMVLVLGIASLIVFPSRANWRAKKEKVKVVEFVGFWRRVAIQIVDVVLCLFIVPLFFNIAYYFRDGQTIADKIYGTKIVDKKTHETASVGKLFIRLISKQFSKAAFGIGFWAAGWRKEKLAWHDGLADVRYVSYKKVHGIWTFVPFLLLLGLPIVISIVIGTINGYQEMSQMMLDNPALAK